MRDLGLIEIDFDQPPGYSKGTFTDHRSGQAYSFEKAGCVAEIRGCSGREYEYDGLTGGSLCCGWNFLQWSESTT